MKKSVKKIDLSVSIVIYKSDFELLKLTIGSLVSSIEYAISKKRLNSFLIFIIDNDTDNEIFSKILEFIKKELKKKNVFELIKGHGNIGYGLGHNLALKNTNSKYHLVLNPDVILLNNAIEECLNFMSEKKKAVLISPFLVDDNQDDHLCKRYPSLLILFLRGFAPKILKNIFKKKLAHYEMKDLKKIKTAHEVPLVSGFFMFMRLQQIKEIGGFSKEFFMYFEDYDLSLRSASVGKVMLVPKIKVKHFGGNSSKKGFKHIFLFISGAIIFFKKFGWRFF